jgi:general nucleoside transport system permease protein
MDVLIPLLNTGLALATPLLLVALGEIVSERAGVLNIGVEGLMLFGALFGVVAGFLTGNVWLGLGAASLSGMFFSGGFGWLVIRLRTDQVLTGTGLNIFALGLTAVLRREIFGLSGETLTVSAIPRWPIPGLSAIPVIGPILFSQDPLVYVGLISVGGVWWWLYRTASGLALRSVGENPEAAESVGLNVNRFRWIGTLTCGAACGLAGGHLSLGLSNTFVEGMTAGRGFIALAIVIVGRWNPFGALLAALAFGTATALQFRFQALGLTAVPYQFFLMLPYVLTILAAAVFSRRGGAPAALGRTA